MGAQKTVLVVGASRGLGLALVQEFSRRGWGVVATKRGPSEALDRLAEDHSGSVTIEYVDVARVETVRDLRRRLDGREFDVLFVNAGIARAIELSPLEVQEQDYVEMLITNALSPIRVIQLFEDLVSADGVIAVMSSELGSIGNSSGFWQLYSSSKAALNMLMKSFAAGRPNDPRALLLVAPGWVKTDMGTEDAVLEVEDSIPLVVDLVERSAGEPGLRYVDRFGHGIPW